MSKINITVKDQSDKTVHEQEKEAVRERFWIVSGMVDKINEATKTPIKVTAYLGLAQVALFFVYLFFHWTWCVAIEIIILLVIIVISAYGLGEGRAVRILLDDMEESIETLHSTCDKIDFPEDEHGSEK